MFEVVGIQKIEFPDRNTGATVTGNKLFVCEKRDNVDGLYCESFFLKASIACPKLGDKIDVYYNRYGKVQDVIVRKE